MVPEFYFYRPTQPVINFSLAANEYNGRFDRQG